MQLRVTVTASSSSPLTAFLQFLGRLDPPMSLLLSLCVVAVTLASPGKGVHNAQTCSLDRGLLS